MTAGAGSPTATATDTNSGRNDCASISAVQSLGPRPELTRSGDDNGSNLLNAAIWSRLGAGVSAVAAVGLMAAPAWANPTPTPTPTAVPATPTPPVIKSSPTVVPTRTPSTAGPSLPERYDVAAFGATASGRLGSVVRISIGMTNFGPATAPGHTGVMGPVQGFSVTLPPGTEVVGDPGGCAAPPQVPPNLQGGTKDGCLVQRFFSGGVGGLPDGDIDPSNNAAPIVITVVTGDTLPRTGRNLTVIAATGVASIVAGSLLLVLRRRRARPTA
jgi:LPXTG-motif cell wall-anchored protein